MTEPAIGARELSAGVFDENTLPEFDITQAWRRDAYWSAAYFGKLNSGNSLHQITGTHEISEQLDLVYRDLVLGMGSITTEAASFKINRESIGRLRRGFTDDPEALSVLDGLKKKVDQREADWWLERRERVGEYVAKGRDRLHVMVDSSETESNGKIKAYFGKLWGLTVDSRSNKLMPVVVGKDERVARLRSMPSGLWLYAGTLAAKDK